MLILSYRVKLFKIKIIDVLFVLFRLTSTISYPSQSMRRADIKFDPKIVPATNDGKLRFVGNAKFFEFKLN